MPLLDAETVAWAGSQRSFRAPGILDPCQELPVAGRASHLMVVVQQ